MESQSGRVCFVANRKRSMQNPKCYIRKLFCVIFSLEWGLIVVSASALGCVTCVRVSCELTIHNKPESRPVLETSQRDSSFYAPYDFFSALAQASFGKKYHHQHKAGHHIRIIWKYQLPLSRYTYFIDYLYGNSV